MSTAQNLLVGYGVVVLTYGLLLGVPLAVARSSAPSASRHLVTAHLSGLMQGPFALGMAFAIGAVAFDSTLATVASALVVGGLAAETLGGTLNWLQGTGDQFAEKGLGFWFNAMTGVLAIPGALIITVAVIAKL
jgi:hypothetical protein